MPYWEPILSDLCQDGAIIAVYTRKQAPDTFFAGQPAGCQKDYLALRMVTPDGVPDGLCLCHQSLVYRIEAGTHYLEALMQGGKFPAGEAFPCPGDLDALLTFAEQRKAVLQLEDFHGKRLLFGIPLSHTPSSVLVRRVCLDGRKGAQYRLPLCKIGYLYIGTDSERSLEEILERGDSHAVGFRE